MPLISSNSIELYYESFGSANNPTVLLIMGLGAQLTRWNIELCDLLVERGYRVIRFDNRDCGLSTLCEWMPLPNLGAAFKGFPLNSVPYTLDTMAADCIGLLDGLNISEAHIVGASMGAAIAQNIAAHYPERTLSLTSIMSSSGNPMLPPPTPAAAIALFAPLPSSRDRATIIADSIVRYVPLSSPGYPTKHADLEEMFGREFDRKFYPPGVARQLGSLMANGDRRPLLKRITCPTVVLHGKDDPLIQLPCGQDVANNISAAKLKIVDGMGHDFPVALTQVFADAICDAAYH
jgi:pimeloyl-ACP methyl ester carboxylesterase